MKYTPGDKVLLLHSGEEGTVIEILDKEMVMVEVDGIQFPVYEDQIDFPYFQRFTEQRKEKKKPESTYVDDIRKEKMSPTLADLDVRLLLVPFFDPDIYDDEVITKFKIYLGNYKNENYRFRYHVNCKGKMEFEISSELPAQNNFYLHDLMMEELSDVSAFEFRFSLLKTQKTISQFADIRIKKNAKQIMNKIEDMKMNNEPSFYFTLFETYPDKKEEMIPDYNGPSNQLMKIHNGTTHEEPVRTVIDLHIDKLTDNWKSMSNFEMLTLQLSTFEKYYDQALLHRQTKLIVIHGVGKGKLRDEIHLLLQHRHEVKSYVNEYHPLFGYGATEIYFQFD